MTARPFLFNPFMADPELLAGSLARRESISRALESFFQGLDPEQERIGVLVRGGSGSGKTHLLAHWYWKLRGSPYGDPLVLPFEVGNLRFLRDEDFSRLSTIDLLEKTGRSPSLFEGAGETGRSDISVLLLDNLETVIEFAPAEGLASALNEAYPGRFLMIASTGVGLDSILPELDPLGLHWNVLELEPLTPEESEDFLLAWAHSLRTGSLASTLKERQGEVTALVHLLGGVPRYLVTALDVLSQEPDIAVGPCFLRILDLLSPRFQAVFERLTPHQRRIVDVMARSSNLMGPTEIAHAAGMDVGSVNVQMGRMAREGVLVHHRSRGRKRVRYELEDRLFRAFRRLRIDPGAPALDSARQLRIWFGHAGLEDELGRALTGPPDVLAAEETVIPKPCPPARWYETRCAVIRPGVLFEAQRPFDVMSLLNADLLQDIQTRKPLSREAQRLLLELLGTHYEGSKDPSPGILSDILREDRDLPEIWNELGNAQVRAGDHERALESYRNALALLPRAHEIPYNMGNAYYDRGMYEDAIEAYDRSLELDPGVHETWHNRGCAQASEERFEEAAHSLFRSLELRYKAFVELRRMAQDYLRSEQSEKADLARQTCLETKKETFDGLADLLEWGWTSLELDLRWKICERIVDLSQDHPKYWNLFGNLHAWEEEHGKALQCYERACIPDNPEISISLLNRAREELLLHRFEQAARSSSDALSVSEEGRVEDRNVAAYLNACAELMLARVHLNRDSAVLAERAIVNALRSYTRASSHTLEDLFCALARELLHNGNLRTLSVLFQEMDRLGLDILSTFLRPYRTALEIVDGASKAPLESFHAELRSMARDIVSSLERLLRSLEARPERQRTEMEVSSPGTLFPEALDRPTSSTISETPSDLPA
jgi:tetratricopeptide (TPR) repeat protein